MSWHAPFLREWKAKLVWGTMLHPVVGGLYWMTQSYPRRIPTEMVPTHLDNAIPFLPATAWLYQSLFLAMPLTFFLLRDGREIRRFFWGITGLCVAANLIFILFPTTMIRPFPPTSWAYQHLILAIDGPGNAFPSLHAALGVFTFLCAWRTPGARWVRLVGIGWLMLLLISTLTTKQHVLMDLAGGVILGGLCSIAAYSFGLNSGSWIAFPSMGKAKESGGNFR